MNSNVIVKRNNANIAMTMVGNLGKELESRKGNFVSMAEVEVGEVEWLWEHRIPLGGITLLEGDPGHGKSTLTDDLVARLTTGRAMPLCESPEKAIDGGAVLLRGEESLGAVVRPRLEAAGADLDRVLAVGPKSPLRVPRDMAAIWDGVKEVGAKLVVIDPLSHFVEGSLNSSGGMRRTLGPLAALADELNIAVVLVRHLGKGGSGRAIYRGLGSVSIIGLARSALLVAPDPSSDDKYRHMLAVNKSNLASAKSVSYQTEKNEAGVIGINWLGTTSHSAQALASGTDHVLECSELERAMDLLYGILVEGEVPQQRVLSMARKADVAKRTLYRAKQAMKIKSKRIGRTCWVWRLPEGEVDAVAASKERYFTELFDWLANDTEHTSKR